MRIFASVALTLLLCISRPSFGQAQDGFASVGEAPVSESKSGAAGQDEPNPPLIDVHRHAAWPWSDRDGVKLLQLEKMREVGIVTAVVAVTDYDEVERWSDAPVIVGVRVACPRNLAEPRYRCFPGDEGWPDLHWLESEIASGRVGALHELGLNYIGLSPTNPRLAPYWALAAKYNIPVGVHTQRGPGRGAQFSSRSDPNCCPNYDPEMGNPALLRPILKRHPGLRLWIQHVGAGRGDHLPFWDETLALLRDFPQVSLDLSITNGAMPVEQYEDALKRLIDAGFGDRIMFGSDNLDVAPILNRLHGIVWLSEEQLQAIKYRNAVRFFRLEGEP